VSSYKIDGRDATGIVVVGPKAGDAKSLYIWSQQPGDAAAVSVAEAVRVAHSKAPAPMNWDFD